MKPYNHITQSERELIFLYNHYGKSYREIGRLLGRDHRTIGREIQRNKKGNKYSAMEAHKLAENRRNTVRIGSRKLDDPTISHETIYQFIYHKENKKLRLWELLRRQHRKRNLFYGRKTKKHLIIPNRLFIDQRPKIINQRKEIGHWETDLMEGKKKQKSHVSVVVERKSRLVKLTKVKTKKAEVKTNSLIKQLRPIPQTWVKTITYDNGKENFGHEQVAHQLSCKTYFCNPYHSWEKGSIENIIGLVRQYSTQKDRFRLHNPGRTKLDCLAIKQPS